MDHDGPARKAIRLLGVREIADECGLTTDAVYKWANRSKGLIPAEHQAAVLMVAARQGVALTPADMIGAAR